MRYITHRSNLCLFKNDGTILHRFGAQGIYIKGLATTESGTGNYIDATSGTGLQMVWPTDLDGNAVTRLEMAGMGSLSGYSDAGNALATLAAGYTRNFFESPELTAGTDTVPATSGIKYDVLTGYVYYSGVKYEKLKNETFTTDGGTTAVSGSGTFATTIPDELNSKCDMFLDEQFKIKHLMKGDEAEDYYDWLDGGFDPKDDLTTTEADTYMWTR